MTSLITDELGASHIEQDLLSRLLDLSRQELNGGILRTHLIMLLNQHQLLKDKVMALWYVTTKNKLNCIASQNLNDSFKNDLHEQINYEHPDWYFLKIKSTDTTVHSGFVQTDIYLEKTSHCLLGISFWYETSEFSGQLSHPFFKDLFSLINLILVKACYSELLIQDIEQQKKNYEMLLLQQASYDGLTNLPNRFSGYTQLERAIGSAQKQQKKLAVLFLDLDEFKQINNSLGHPIGDVLLKIVAERYASLMGPNDMIIRMGGDEFMIIMESLSSESYASELAQKCQESCLLPFELESEELFISSSIGIAFYPEHGVDAQTLMRHADAAMYQSKMRGKNNWTIFLNSMSAANDRIRMKSELHQALNRNELYLCYQPIINVADNKISSVEALLRWESSTFGLVMPEQIISIAEETGLIISFGFWILKTVCKQINEWRTLTNKPIKVAVNISIAQLRQEHFVDQVQLILESSGVPAELLIFEITESVFIDDSAFILSQLNRLNEMNIECSIDDFGTGYSSLNYIRSYPFNTLKIDRSFISGIEHNSNSLSLVNSIISMSHNLNLTVIAEGIENEQQFELLRSIQCDQVQGWYFAKALTSQELLQYLNNS